MKTIGRHLIIEFYGCDVAAIDNVSRIREGMLGAAEKVGATIVGETFHHYSPQGVSGTVVIAESHLSVHTWPEAGYVAVDIYTCGGLDPRKGIEHLAEVFEARTSRYQEILRGLPEDVAEGRQWVPADVQVMEGAGETLQFKR